MPEPDHHHIEPDPLDTARRLYAQMAREVEADITRLREGADDAPDPKKRADLIRAHHKTLMLLLEFEAKLAKESQDTGTGGTLDLEAARREITQRLARLRVTGTG